MAQQPYDHNRDERGAVLLLSLLVFTAVGMAIIASLLLFEVVQVETSFAREQSGQAKGLADACAEEALQQISDSTSFSGSGTLTLGEGTCAYTITNLGGSNREIEAVGTVDTIVRKVLISIDTINPSINVTSWQEVADF
ncbi:hypothetical protein HY626_02815 [Candidatus Uhrbacteria bacterium]|nr:hypothetical protein [Candidatus Uhrbacteria bacterium]